jgi:hypothetical protein
MDEWRCFAKPVTPFIELREPHIHHTGALVMIMALHIRIYTSMVHSHFTASFKPSDMHAISQQNLATPSTPCKPRCATDQQVLHAK